MADDFIFIGEDGTGDKLCYRIIDKQIDGKVYIWYHETGELEELDSSLKEFIVSTTGYEDDENEYI